MLEAGLDVVRPAGPGPGPALSLLLLGPLVYGHHTYCARSAASSSTKYHCLFSVCAVCIHNNLSQDYYHFTFHIYAGSLDRLAQHYCYWMNVNCVYSTLHLYRCVKIWCTAHVLIRLCPMSVWDFLDEVPYIAERERETKLRQFMYYLVFRKEMDILHIPQTTSTPPYICCCCCCYCSVPQQENEMNRNVLIILITSWCSWYTNAFHCQ